MAIRFTREELEELGYEEGEDGVWRKRRVAVSRRDPCKVSKPKPRLREQAESAAKVKEALARYRNEGNRRGDAKLRIVVIARCKRETDPDNLVPKWFIDCLRQKVIPDDSSKYIYEVAKRVEKIGPLDKEETIIEVWRGERMERPRVVCLCGSTRFYEAFAKANLEETLAGRIVLSVGCHAHSDSELGISQDSDTKKMLDELHLRKIDMADEVLILNVEGYIGESTRKEMEYAIELGKKVRFLEMD